MLARRATSRQQFRSFLREYVLGKAATSTGHAEAASDPPRTFALLQHFWPWLRRQCRPTLLALLLLTVATGFRLVMPATTKLAIDHVFLGLPLPGFLARLGAWLREPHALLVVLGAAAVAAGVLERLTRVVGLWYAEQTALRLRLSLRRRLFRHLLRLPLHRLARLRTGGLAGLLREDPASAGRLVQNLLVHSWQAVVQLAGGLLLLAWLAPRLLLGAMLTLPVLGALHWLSRRYIRPLHEAAQAARSAMDGQAAEVLAGVRVVRVFGRQRALAARDVAASHWLVRTDLLLWWFQRAVDLAWGFILPLASAAILVVGGFGVLDGLMTLGDLILLLFFLSLILEPLGLLVGHVADAQQSLAALDRLLRLLAEPVEGPPQPGRLEVSSELVRGHVLLRDVSFRYPGSAAPALQQVTLELRPGESVALIGPSGAGKTTICNLLARFHEPTAGAVELDGIDVRRLDLSSYRRLIGIVEQDVFLFAGTVAENIAFGRRQATPDDVRRAAALAGADGFIAGLPHGYDTVLGERGHRLSGGQRQRLALARAFLTDPRLLILDEATSHLDGDSEWLLGQVLGRLLQGRTCLIVAHRLSTVRLARRVVVLEGGRVVADGDHATLAARPGFYRRMMALQLGLREDAA